MNLSVLEIIGYIASVIVAISIAMTSVLRFRILNAIGALLFSIYGFAIGAYPVGFLNGFITLINFYYLHKLFSFKEEFEFIETDINNPYVKRFLTFHQKDILKFFPNFDFTNNSFDVCFLMLRNTNVAGIFLGYFDKQQNLWIELDYVIKEYRDLKNGKHLYNFIENTYRKKHLHKILAKEHSPVWKKYMLKLGFTENCNRILEKTIQ